MWHNIRNSPKSFLKKDIKYLGLQLPAVNVCVCVFAASVGQVLMDRLSSSQCNEV